MTASKDKVYVPALADAFVYLELVGITDNGDGSATRHSKFWEARLAGPRLTTRWGRIGSPGQTKIEEFGTVHLAFASYERQVAAKMAKGYSVEAEKGERFRRLGDAFAVFAKDGAR